MPTNTCGHHSSATRQPSKKKPKRWWQTPPAEANTRQHTPHMRLVCSPSKDVGVVCHDVVEDGHKEAKLYGPREILSDGRETLVARHQAPADAACKTDLICSGCDAVILLVNVGCNCRCFMNWLASRRRQQEPLSPYGTSSILCAVRTKLTRQNCVDIESHENEMHTIPCVKKRPVNSLHGCCLTMMGPNSAMG